MKAQILKATFDTATTDSSGAANTTIAAHGLGVYVPKNAIITRVFYDVITTFTSSSDAATIALKALSTGDIKAAMAISDGTNVWDAGLHGGLMGNAAEATVSGDTAILAAARLAASYVKMTSSVELIVTVAVEALTAGKAIIYVEYIQSE